MGIPTLDDPEVVAVEESARLFNRLARLLLLVWRGSDDKMKLAVGGAVAVSDAGYGRHTEDLDVFARPVSAKRLVKALHAQGMKTFWITEAHAVAWLDEDNAEAVAKGEAPTLRIDILSTITEPEASAIRTAIPARRLGVPLKVFRPDHLAAIKFLAGRGKDLVDFDGLVAQGVDIERVRYLIATVDEAKAAAMMARVRKLQKPRGLRDGGMHYATDAELQRAFAARYAAARAQT